MTSNLDRLLGPVISRKTTQAALVLAPDSSTGVGFEAVELQFAGQGHGGEPAVCKFPWYPSGLCCCQV